LTLLFAMSLSIAGHRTYARTSDDTGPIVSISIYYSERISAQDAGGVTRLSRRDP
jgi:hypothetical protein